MRINYVTAYKSSMNLKQTPNNRNQHVSFGYGDYGDEDPTSDAPNPSLLTCIKLGIKIPFVVCSEIFSKKEKQRILDLERLGRQFEEQEKREREGLNKNDDLDLDAGLFYDDDDL